MQRFSLWVITFFIVYSVSSHAKEYRHLNIDRRDTGFYYVKVALQVPLTNDVTQVEKMQIVIPEFSELNEIGIAGDWATKNTGSYGFPANKIGASFSIGFKTSYYSRFEVKVDFMTASKKLYFPPEPSFFDQLLELENPDSFYRITTRHLGIIPGFYLELDNPSRFTPYIGVGAGIALTQSFISYDTGDSLVMEPDSTMFDRVLFAYEYKGGIRIGTKKVFVDLEGAIRKIPGLTLTMKTVALGIGFRI
jgi:hypothetical protein